MKLRLGPLVIGGFAAGAATLIYGCLVASKEIKVEHYRLELPGWPERLAGFRLCVMGDFHLKDKYSLELAQKAIALALDQSPDMIALVGDFLGYWKMDSPAMLGDLLEPLLLMEGKVVAVPGNHDYWAGDASLLRPILDALSIKLLRNEAYVAEGIRWVGIDSAVQGKALPIQAMSEQPDESPSIVLWHEPDYVDLLPRGAQLMVSGHSHGGQFRFPGGFTPMYTRGGKRYPRGFYPHASTPLFVTRGIGTTGPPARLNCSAEVAILELHPPCS